jgi:hypothetical protein
VTIAGVTFPATAAMHGRRIIGDPNKSSTLSRQRRIVRSWSSVAFGGAQFLDEPSLDLIKGPPTGS